MRQLIDDAFLRQLSRLRFITKGRRQGHLSGTHASPRAGVSLEFADYRPYTPGDDFRYVDWNVYGRLDRVLVKRFVHESDLPIYLLVDFSASMGLGSPTKAFYAARLAAALAYLGLRGLDRVGAYPFNDRLAPSSVPPRHGMRQMSRILRALLDVRPEGETSIDGAVNQLLTRTRESGLVIVVSDFLSPDGYRQGMARLRHRGDEAVAIQVLDRAELHPTGTGTTELVDVESKRHAVLTVGRSTLAAYEERFSRHQEELRGFLLERGIPYFLGTTDRPVVRLIHEDLRRGGVLK
jgi:uncharacterized protein (DUF58 family)